MAKSNKIDKRIEKAYYASCSGIQIPIMSIPKIFAVGKTAIAENPDITQEALETVIRTFVETIKVN